MANDVTCENLQALIEELVTPKDQDRQKHLESQLLKVLKLSPSQHINITYLLMLYRQFQRKDERNDQLVIQYPKKNLSADVTIAYPTALQNDYPELFKSLPVTFYKTICHYDHRQAALDACLVVKKMQAGTGSSLERTKYKEELLKLHPRHKNLSKGIGAKGTDIYVEITHTHGTPVISLAEVQILQLISMIERKLIGKIGLQNIVSTETIEPLQEILEQPVVGKINFTYSQLFGAHPHLELIPEMIQALLPTIDEAGKFSMNRMAPGGHALFGVATILEILDSKYEQDQNTIISIGNGEDLSSTPDECMVGWMCKNQIPIAMVTTTKTENDLKGGQIAVVKKPNGNSYVTIIEKAQSEMSGQGKLFEDLGLRPGDAQSLFNTNMALFNAKILRPKLAELREKIGDEKFFQCLTPDLILNKKSQKDTDGVKRNYIQLEGALGSVLLNLDQAYRAHFGKPLVHFLNVERENRTMFFAPLKTAFDVVLQFHSNRFSLDQSTWKLINHRPGYLPSANFDCPKDPDYYKELQNMLDTFDGADILELDDLGISGKVQLDSIKLSGKVRIRNEGAHQIALKETPLHSPVKDQEILIDDAHSVQVKPVNNF